MNSENSGNCQEKKICFSDIFALINECHDLANSCMGGSESIRGAILGQFLSEKDSEKPKEEATLGVVRDAHRSLLKLRDKLVSTLDNIKRIGGVV